MATDALFCDRDEKDKSKAIMIKEIFIFIVIQLVNNLIACFNKLFLNRKLPEIIPVFIYLQGQSRHLNQNDQIERIQNVQF